MIDPVRGFAISWIFAESKTTVAEDGQMRSGLTREAA